MTNSSLLVLLLGGLAMALGACNAENPRDTPDAVPATIAATAGT
jgi:hypothetical protein